jgi:DNA-binding XRE family transcriptional regulator
MQLRAGSFDSASLAFENLARVTVDFFGVGAMSDRKNNVQRLREERLLSKAELARRAGVSVLTIDRVERGEECRLDTKRKIILALGLRVSDREKVFSDNFDEERDAVVMQPVGIEDER